MLKDQKQGVSNDKKSQINYVCQRDAAKTLRASLFTVLHLHYLATESRINLLP